MSLLGIKKLYMCLPCLVKGMLNPLSGTMYPSRELYLKPGFYIIAASPHNNYIYGLLILETMDPLVVALKHVIF
ncbi:hypothetical protein EUGRSUZ_J00602 [Eucalyptus grandis]|uniref:Uncharacterized protein n=2 Tax=Eucalyptus grandis TaxID=71139 RepID=A0ACC3J3S8_EUCGR|nr:hypothetical protein EUGRSUZ_J00602 [Eucalyptus grandis]